MLSPEVEVGRYPLPRTIADIVPMISAGKSAKVHFLRNAMAFKLGLRSQNAEEPNFEICVF